VASGFISHWPHTLVLHPLQDTGVCLLVSCLVRCDVLFGAVWRGVFEMSREAMQLALEALEKVIIAFGSGLTLQQNAITALRQALETKQEPVAWMFVNEDGECEQIEYGPVFDDPGVTPLYAAPPKREWVGLTAYEIQEIHSGNQHWGSFACAIEQALKDKNT
jgi:hypothetical protein